MVQIKLIENEEDKLYRCCPLYRTRTHIVWHRGTTDKDVDVLFIGEAPGKDEDLQGKPFVGKAGKILDQWIEESGLTNYAIVNIIKCRPPSNRAPNKAEIRACLPYLIKQITVFNPKIIVALGRTACSVLIDRTNVTTNLGKIFKSRYGPVIVFPHPAYILRGIFVYVPIEELKKIVGIK